MSDQILHRRLLVDRNQLRLAIIGPSIESLQVLELWHPLAHFVVQADHAALRESTSAPPLLLCRVQWTYLNELKTREDSDKLGARVQVKHGVLRALLGVLELLRCVGYPVHSSSARVDDSLAGCSHHNQTGQVLPWVSSHPGNHFVDSSSGGRGERHGGRVGEEEEDTPACSVRPTKGPSRSSACSTKGVCFSGAAEEAETEGIDRGVVEFRQPREAISRVSKALVAPALERQKGNNTAWIT